MADDLIKGEWSKSKFLDMMKEYPEKIAKINDETVKVLNEQLNSCDEVNLFKEEISKKKLISSKEYELNKNILFAYDTGVTISQPITLSHDHNLLSADEEVQSDVEELGYNAPNTIEKSKLKVGKTVWKGIKHFAKAFLREGWNADITDFFDGTVRELSDFTMLVGETYDKDSRFRNNFDGVFSKIIGNSDSQYSIIIDSIVDKCIDEKVIEKTEDISSKVPAPSLGPEHDVESPAEIPLTPENEETDLNGINLDSSKKIFDKLNEIKPLLSFDSSIIDKIVQPDTEKPGYYKYIFDSDKYIISDELSVKKYNVIINFTDYLINKWKKGALFSQMTKNSKAVNYPKTLTKFINNINFIIQDEKDAQTKTMKTVFLYQQMKKEQIDKALAFMLYTIYLAKANFDNNKNISKENEAEKNKERFMNAIDKIYELIDAKPENTNYKVEKATVDNHKSIIITFVDKNKKYTIDWVKFTRNPMNNNTYIYRFLDNIATDDLTIEKLLKFFVTFVTEKGTNNYNGMTEESL